MINGWKFWPQLSILLKTQLWLFVIKKDSIIKLWGMNLNGFLEENMPEKVRKQQVYIILLKIALVVRNHMLCPKSGLEQMLVTCVFLNGINSTFIPLRFILWISIQPHNTLKLCPLKALEKNWETAGTVTQQWLYENVLSGVFWLFLFIKTSKYFIIFLSININKGLLTVITWKSFGLTSLPCLWRPGSSAAASLPTSLLCDHAHKSRKRRGNINNQHQSFSFTVCS